MTGREVKEIRWNEVTVRAVSDNLTENSPRISVYQVWYLGNPALVAFGDTLNSAVASLLDKTPWNTPAITEKQT